jgi:hypothetical protein
MKQLMVAMLIMLAVMGRPGAAQEATAEAQAAIASVISGQIDAFRADDFTAAFEFASPTIRNAFRTAENFGAMVRGGYPMVWRPDEVRFLEARMINGALWQKVMIRDQAGAVHLLDYQMVQSPGGGWLINAVQVLQAPDLAA